MKRADKIKLAVAILMFIGMSTVTFAQSSQVRDHAKLQKENSFESRMRDSEAFTLKSLKEDRRDAKKKNKEDKKRNNVQAKKERIRQDILSLKNN